MMGYPCLVTPFSQYVKNMALMNVMQMEKGKERWTIIADEIWDMMLGKSGKLPGPLAPELEAIAKEQGREFHTEDPQSNFPDALDTFREEMKKENWDLGQDNEELFELAMHPQQYRAYKSGKAKRDFLADLEERKAKRAAVKGGVELPQTIVVDVNGVKYNVTVGANNGENASALAGGSVAITGEGNDLLSPLEGKAYLIKNAGEVPVKVGDTVKKGQVVCYVESMKNFNAISAEADGVITQICFTSGSSVSEDDVLMKIK